MSGSSLSKLLGFESSASGGAEGFVSTGGFVTSFGSVTDWFLYLNESLFNFSICSFKLFSLILFPSEASHQQEDEKKMLGQSKKLAV